MSVIGYNKVIVNMADSVECRDCCDDRSLWVWWWWCSSARVNILTKPILQFVDILTQNTQPCLTDGAGGEMWNVWCWQQPLRQPPSQQSSSSLCNLESWLCLVGPRSQYDTKHQDTSTDRINHNYSAVHWAGGGTWDRLTSEQLSSGELSSTRTC